MKNKFETKRAMNADTQFQNMQTSNERNVRQMLDRDDEREQSHREVTEQVQQAAFIQKLEKREQ